MARVTIEDFDSRRHGNPMRNIDDLQHQRHNRAPTIVRCKVCLVDVCGFTFIFHSISQLQVCLDYYSRECQPSSRLPDYSEDLCWPNFQAQRWFEKLPQYLLEKPKRLKVVAALEAAIVEYSKVPEAKTGISENSQYG